MFYCQRNMYSSMFLIMTLYDKVYFHVKVDGYLAYLPHRTKKNKSNEKIAIRLNCSDDLL